MMREKAAILDLAEPVWGNETPGNGAVSVETPGGADLVVIGTTEDIVAGSVLIKSSSALARVCALCVQAIRVLEDPCRDRWIRCRAQVVRSRLEFLLCSAGDQCVLPCLRTAAKH